MGVDGKFTPLRQATGDYYDLKFSPDGSRLALELNDGKRVDIWVYEWVRDTLTRLTFGGESNFSPVWTPDGRELSTLRRKTATSLTCTVPGRPYV